MIILPTKLSVIEVLKRLEANDIIRFSPSSNVFFIKYTSAGLSKVNYGGSIYDRQRQFSVFIHRFLKEQGYLIGVGL